MREPVPAMQPLHDKPPAPIEPGAIWAKRASGKTSVNRPRCTVVEYRPMCNYAVLFRWSATGTRQRCTEAVFRRDWEPA